MFCFKIAQDAVNRIGTGATFAHAHSAGDPRRNGSS